jgi:hypothetical protein
VRGASGRTTQKIYDSKSVGTQEDAMSVHATLILDSGCFLPVPENHDGSYNEVGYFSSSDKIPDIQVCSDGESLCHKKKVSTNLAKGSQIIVRVSKNGKPRKGKVEGSSGFQGYLLHLRDLYGKDITVDRSKFDCILRFEAGFFTPVGIKPRRFKRYSKQSSGTFAHVEGADIELDKPIAHGIHVHFKLKNDEVLELISGKQVIWSSKRADAKNHLEIEIVADNSTAEKFYRFALEAGEEDVFLPNQGDPPPLCPQPPCWPPD